MRVVAVAAAMAAAALAYSLPRVRAQNSSTSNSTGAGVAVATSSASANGVTASNGTRTTASATASNVPIVIAQGISVRALALGPAAADSAAASGESSQVPPIYFTAVQMPNRVVSLGSESIGGAGTSTAGNNVSAMGAGMARGAPNAAAAQAEAYATVAGNGTAGSLGDGGSAAAAQLSLKLDSMYMRSGVAVAPDGTIFIADTKNATIRRISSASSSEPGVIRSIAGKWGPTQNVQLSEPMGLALDRAGNLYIADHGANAVIELHDATAPVPGKLGMLAQVAKATGVAVMADGSRVFIAAAESGSLLGFDAGTHGITTLVAPSGTSSSCLPAAAGRAPTGTASSGAQNFCSDGLALDGGENLFVADSAGRRILRVDASTQKVTTAASNVSMPGDIAFDADGNLFIAEQGRNRISEIKGLGQPVANVTLTPPPAPVPPMGVPCPVILPPPAFAGNTNFCAEPLAGITPTAPFTLTNNSNAALSGIAIATIGLAPTDFVVSSTSCTTSLNAGASCVINVGFAPTATGTRTATLVVNYTGATNPLASSLAGTGDDFQIAFASGQLTEISINAGDTGTFNLQVVPDSIFTGTVTPICPGNLPIETTCTFSLASVVVSTPGTAVPFSAMFVTTSRKPVPPPKTGAAPMMGRVSGGGNLVARGAIGAIVLIAVFCFARFSSVGFSLRRKLLRPGTLQNEESKEYAVWSSWHGANEKNASAEEPSIYYRDTFMRRRRLKPTLLKRAVPITCAVALAIGVAAILEGCHSGSGSNTGPTGTPAGTYIMTVQATSQSAPRGITVTLDVQ
jgi:sugar lactone lactonase YvrE